MKAGTAPMLVNGDSVVHVTWATSLEGSGCSRETPDEMAVEIPGELRPGVMPIPGEGVGFHLDIPWKIDEMLLTWLRPCPLDWGGGEP